MNCWMHLAWCCEHTDAGLELILNGDRKDVWSACLQSATRRDHARQRTLNASQRAPSRHRSAATPTVRRVLHENPSQPLRSRRALAHARSANIRASTPSTCRHLYLLTGPGLRASWDQVDQGGAGQITSAAASERVRASVCGEPSLHLTPDSIADLKQCQLLDDGILSAPMTACILLHPPSWS